MAKTQIEELGPMRVPQRGERPTFTIIQEDAMTGGQVVPSEEEQEEMLRNRASMIGAAQGPFNLGGNIPAFPSTLANINPEPTAPLIPFRGGGTAEMNIGGAPINYPSRLGLSGGDYGTRFQFGAEEFGPARLPQESMNMLEQQYTNPFRTPSERMGETLTRGLTPVAPQESTSITEGPVSMGISGKHTAIQRGLQPIQTPRGTIYATEQQASNMMAPRTLAQQGTRTPSEQQALLAQMRQRGAELARQRVQGQEQFFAQKQAERNALRRAAGEAYLSGISPQTVRSARESYESQQPSSIAGIQRQYATMAPTFDRPMAERTAFVREPFGFPSGGPQPAETPSIPRPSTSGQSTMMAGGSPFSFTPFSRTMQEPEPSPLRGFRTAISPSPIDRRFRPLPFGMRQFGTV